MKRLTCAVTVGLLLFAPVLFGQDSLNVSAVSQLDWAWGGCDDMAIAGTYGYAITEHGLYVLDLTNPAVPLHVARLLPDTILQAVALMGSHLLATSATGLHVLDLATPGQPQLVTRFPGGSARFGLAASGTRAFLVSDSSLRIVDLSNPAEPVLAGVCTLNVAPMSVLVSGNYAYVSDHGWQCGLQVVNVSVPSIPVPLGRCVFGSDHSSDRTGLAVAGNHVFVCCAVNGVYSINVLDPDNPVLAGHCLTSDWAMDAVVSGNYLFVADNAAGLTVVDISNPASPVPVGGVDTWDWTWSICLSGGEAYLPAGSCIFVMDVSNPLLPELTGTIEPGVTDAALTGNHTIVIRWDGLRVVDHGGPLGPREISGVYYPAYDWRELFVTGTTAYAVSTVGIYKFDLSVPATPALICSLHIDNDLIETATAAGTWVYTFGLRMHSFDFSDPLNPCETASIDLNPPETVYKSALAGDYLFGLSLTAAALVIVDVSDPAQPVQVTRYVLPEEMGAVAAEGSYVYLGGASGLWIVDVSLPSLPFIAGQFAEAQGVNRIVVDGGFAYLGRWSDFQVVNVTDPQYPALSGFYDTEAGNLTMCDVEAGLICCARWGDLHYYRFAPQPAREAPSGAPARFALQAAFPNPFNSATTVTFDLPRAAIAELSVFNLLGQRVATLTCGPLAAGRHQTVWNAESWPSGTYLIRLDAGTSQAARKVLLLR